MVTMTMTMKINLMVTMTAIEKIIPRLAGHYTRDCLIAFSCSPLGCLAHNSDVQGDEELSCLYICLSNILPNIRNIFVQIFSLEPFSIFRSQSFKAFKNAHNFPKNHHNFYEMLDCMLNHRYQGGRKTCLCISLFSTELDYTHK